MKLSNQEISHQRNKHEYENLVFEGGGIKGFAYIGAIEVLAREGILPKVKRVAGTSAGAMTALLLGLGYDLQSSREELEKIFFDSYSITDTLTKAPKVVKNLLWDFGVESADFFLKWAEKIVEQKLGNKNATFTDAYKAILNQKGEEYNLKYMYYTGANLNTGYYEIFSHEHTPDMRIADAVRISMSIPLVFTAKRYTKPGNAEADVYVDGGLINNYPLHLFDEHNQPNMKTLGFRVDPFDEISVLRDKGTPQRTAIKGFVSYAKALLSTTLNVANNASRRSDDRIRTVFIDITGVDTLSFKLSKETQERIIESGRRATSMYLTGRPEKLKTDKLRLERYDRKKIYDHATEVYYCSIDAQTTKVQYWFKDSELREINKYVDRLKNQERSHLIEVYSGAVDDKLKIIEVITGIDAYKEMEKWALSSNKASKGIKVLLGLPLVKMESWTVQDYVEQKVQNLAPALELIEAAHGGNINKVIDLLSAGITPDAKDKQGCTALYYAAEFGYQRIVELLLRNDIPANINAQDNSGETALHKASFQGHLNIVQLLLKHNGSVEIRSAYGATPLHRAAYMGNKEVIILLLQAGSDINAKDEINGDTPLHWVTKHNHKESIKLLLEQGAKTDITNKENKVAQDYAATFEVKEIFREYTRSRRMLRTGGVYSM